MKDSFDLFSGTQKDAMWLEVVEGLSNAQERLQRIAEEKPGQYFVFNVARQAQICEIETFAMPSQPLAKHNAKNSAKDDAKNSATNDNAA